MPAILKIIKANHLFSLYLIGLINFVIVKFFGDMQDVKYRIADVKEQKAEGFLNLQLVPFRTINSTMDSIRRFGFDHPASIALIANIILFVPMGFLLPFVLQKQSFLKTMGISLGIIGVIEYIQFVTNLGAMDIDDVIINMTGCLIGYLVYVVSIIVIKS
jgi:glycopeptide antibiotics resistance protein